MESESSTITTTTSPLVLQYDDQFPPLPTTKSIIVSTSKSPKILNQNSKSSKVAGKLSTTTQTLVVPLSERRFSSANTSTQSSAKTDAQKKIIAQIAQKCAVTIELNSGNKHGDLSVFISGAHDNVTTARRMLAKELSTQAQLQVRVPREFHRFILGKSGTTLREIESASNTNITIPRRLTPDDEDNSSDELITIFGTKDGCDRARIDIESIVSERSRLATERIAIPRRFYPFIHGPNQTTIARIREITGVKINIPPQNAESEEIVISGEKEGVHEAAEWIRKIYDDTKRVSSSLNLPIPKSQHGYVVGPKGSGIAEIFERTGVVVEMPPIGDNDDDTIVLFGPNESLAPALSMVIQKSESMQRAAVSAPIHLHRFIIGKQGANLNRLLDKYPRVFINFPSDGSATEAISIEGPKEDVVDVKRELAEQIAQLESTIAVSELSIDPRFHRHIIGRNGANISRIQDERKVQIRMPGTSAVGRSAWVIRIEGDPEGVKLARAELESMSTKLENEKTKDVIIDRSYHNQLIGSQGQRVKELRQQYPDVIIAFPDPALKSDIVQLRGPRQHVDQVAARLTKLFAELQSNGFTRDLTIGKQFHKQIIGKSGGTIRKIREATGIRIDFPDEHSDSEKIRLVGRKENVEEAIRQIEALQAELGSVKEIEIEIPHRFHFNLIGPKGKIIKSIQQECGGVLIQFPPSDSDSSVVRIKGPEPDVEKARQQLLDLSEKNVQMSHQDSIRVRPEFHKYLIGRKGAHLSEFRKRHSVLLIFPDSSVPPAESPADQQVNGTEPNDLILIIGPKPNVDAAKQELEQTVKSMENEIERVVTIDPKWHRHFFRRRQAVMDEIAREFGGVRIFFPKLQSQQSQETADNVAPVAGSDQVRVVGPKGCVEAAIVRIEDIVENLEAQTSLAVFVEQRHHRSLITRNMTEIKLIQSSLDVQIKFPNRELLANNKSSNENGEDSHLNGSAGSEEPATLDESGADSSEETNPANWVTIFGRIENCEAARDQLLELVPITEDVPLANEFHRNFIGQKGQGINTFSSQHNVVVNIPPANRAADFISIKGPRANIEDAKLGLQQLVAVWDAEKNDRIARNYENQISVPNVFHRHIIGQRGSNIELFRTKFNVAIQIPDQNSGSNEITIRGYEEDVKKAEEELIAIVDRLKAQVKEELHIPRDVHPLLIGTRGIALRKLREQYKVEINFPNRNVDDERAHLVEVIGDKENVDKCCDVLVERANELLYEWEERNQVREVKNSIKDREHTNNSNIVKDKGPGFLVTGAPWQRVPDASSNEDFPTIDANGDKMAATCLVLNGHSE